MLARKSGISAATLVLSGDEFGHIIDMPFLTIHLRSRRDQFSVSASDACASLAFARCTAVMLGVPPIGHRRVSCRIRAAATRSALGQPRTSPAYLAISALPLKADKHGLPSLVHFVPAADIATRSNF